MKMAIGLVFLFGLVGCIRTDHLLLTDHPFSPVADTHPITVFSDPPSQPYTKIAVLKAKQGGGFPSWEDLRESLTKEARAVGADGIIELRMGGELSGAVVGGGPTNSPTVGGMGQYKVLTGIAIKFNQ